MTRRLPRPRADCSKPKPKYPYVRCSIPLIYQPEVFTGGWSAQCVSVNQPIPLLTAQIRQAFVASDETYGMPRIRAVLQDVGVMASRKRIARLMRQAQIRGVSRRRKFCMATELDVRRRPAPDLVVVPFWIRQVPTARCLTCLASRRRAWHHRGDCCCYGCSLGSHSHALTSHVNRLNCSFATA